MTRPLKHSLLLILLAGYTAFAAGPFVWVAIMSLRTTTEIMADHFALPSHSALGEISDRLVQLELQCVLQELRDDRALGGR